MAFCEEVSGCMARLCFSFFNVLLAAIALCLSVFPGYNENNTPAYSRTLNTDCAVLDYFDWDDVARIFWALQGYIVCQVNEKV